ncbi:MAG: response regulator [Bacteroidota bacterium]
MTVNQTIFRWTLAGVLVGCSFPLIATWLELNLNLYTGFWDAQARQPLLWIIDTAPLFLGALAFLVGLRQNRLRNLNQQQEDQIRNRTAELMDRNKELSSILLENEKMLDALRIARDEAESAAKARSEFLSTMSHEIRTPLNAIIGLTGLLGETKLNSEQHDFIETVRMSGESLLAIINDILDYSKIESGNLELEHETFELLEPLEDTFDLLRSKANQKDLELIYDIQSDVPTHFSGDIVRIRQILINLVNNAVKFTEEGEIFVNIRSLAQKEGIHQLEFAVKDTGIGIPKDRLNRLFRSFSQVDASTTRKYGGTGLGLAICKRLVELMEGEIWVESEWQKGTTFFFTVTLSAVSGTVMHAFDPEVLTDKQVLIVDDNATNLTILAKRCENWGLIVRKADHPLKALDLLSEGYHPDLAVLDMNMPSMDGVELAQIIKEKLQPSLPLVMLSSGGAPSDPSHREFFSTWLIKPARKRQLYQAIAKACHVIDGHTPRQTSKRQDGDLKARHQREINILLTEDNKINQKVACRILKRLGFEADVANNGQEAFEAVQKKTYDLVLMDMQMPVMNGLDATRAIRAIKDKTFRQPRIIAMTANAMAEDRARCLDAGMDDFLAKPVKTEDLDGILTKWFHFRGETASSGS